MTHEAAVGELRPAVLNTPEAERAAALQRLHTAQESLHHLDLLLAARDSAVGGAMVRGRAAAARTQVDEAVRLLAHAHAGEPLPVERVPCSFCAQMIMPAATLCGFCWRKRTPAAA